MFIPLVLCWLALVSISQQQKDPLKDFCRIFGHSTTLVDHKLYIDGGLVNWSPLSASSLNYSSTWVKQGDLDVYKNGFPKQSTLAKNESVPSVSGGILWPDEANKLVYQYGGEYGNGQPEDFKLWYYDIVYNSWNVSNASVSGIERASWGAGAVAQDKAKAYYYGGWLTDASVPGYGSRTALQNMLVYDMAGNKFRNQSGPDQTPRAEGSMVYLPVGDSGLLVYFGGIEVDNGTTQGVSMTKIFVYSIADEIWYEEEAGGDVPEDRRRFCAGAVWAADRSSYNIYLYGGASIDEGVGYGDVYILSLPSFKWIKFWPRPEDDVGATFPHHSLTCNVVQNSQMIIMGGHFPNMTTACDMPDSYGQHGLDLGKANKQGSKWAVYNKTLTTYQVPPEIAKTIGGGPTGAATLTAPTGGWKERDLQVQFGRTYTPSARTATRFIPTATGISAPKESNRKAVIGGAVGGAIGALLLVTAAGFCILFYRKKKANKYPEDKRDRPPPELHVKSSGLSSHASSFQSPTTTQYTPHDSPGAPSDQAWSPYGQTQYTSPQSQHSPYQGFGTHELPSSPVPLKHAPYSPQSPTDYRRHEMPGISSPSPVAYGKPDWPLSPQSTFNPYYVRNPPREKSG